MIGATALELLVVTPVAVGEALVVPVNVSFCAKYSRAMPLSRRKKRPILAPRINATNPNYYQRIINE